MRRAVLALLLLAHALAVAAVVVAVAWTPHKPRPCRATFERVTEGMTREEVEATVGSPPGEYTTPGVTALRARRGPDVWSHADMWVCDEAELIVFYVDDRVDAPFIRDVVILPGRWERVWAWVTTGYEIDWPWSNNFLQPGPYHFGTLLDILRP